MRRPVICAAQRTPFGRFLGGGADLSAADLGTAVAQSLLTEIPPTAIDQVIIGNVLGAGAGMNVARQIALRAGVPEAVPALTINQVCGSGLQAVLLAAQAIRLGEAEAVLCGGAESMSNAPRLRRRAPESRPIAGGEDEGDALLIDGLSDGVTGEGMGLTAERLASEFAIGREAQDAYAITSQERAVAAIVAGRFAAQLVPVGGLLRDEHPRGGLTMAKLGTLKTVFKADGTVTPGNSSGLNDGAALLVVADLEVARARGWPVLAEIINGATVGCDPQRMGLGPVVAVRALLTRSGVDLAAIDAIEINEAFAVQTLACCRELGLDPARINTDGGAIAFGHPLAASGARLLTQLAHRCATGSARQALATACVGGGMGVAALLRTVS